eukprot:scaffold3.g6747.t1
MSQLLRRAWQSPRQWELRAAYTRGSGRKRQRRRTWAAAEDEGSTDLTLDFEKAVLTYEAIDEYRRLMQRPDESLSVLEGAVLVARHRHPFASAESVREQLDDLAVQAGAGGGSGRGGWGPGGSSGRTRWLCVASGRDARREAEGWPASVGAGGDAGLRARACRPPLPQDFYDPDNSCIDAVLARRLGIPITLALVYQEVAARLGVALVGVNVPGHFFLAPADPDLDFLIDPFAGGAVSFLEQDAQEVLQRIYQQPVQLDPAFLARKDPLPPRIFLARMLNNLKQIYNLRRDYSAALVVSKYLRATRPGDLDELRDHGVYLYYLKRYAECIDILREFLDLAPPDSDDVRKVRRLLESLRR